MKFSRRRMDIFLLAAIGIVLLCLVTAGVSEAAKTYKITVQQTGCGHIIPIGKNGVLTVKQGRASKFVIKPTQGCYVEDILVDNVSVLLSAQKQGRSWSYTFENIKNDHIISATFDPVPQLVVETFGAGIVRSIPGGIKCGTDCAQQYEIGKTVTLKATPSKGYAFSKWIDCTPDDTDPAKCRVSMDADTRVKAIFITTDISATLYIEPPAITVRPGGIQAFKTTLKADNGKVLSAFPYEWSFNNTTIAKFVYEPYQYSSYAIIIGESPGTTQFTVVTANGKSIAATINVDSNSTRAEEIIGVYPYDGTTISDDAPSIGVSLSYKYCDCGDDHIGGMKLFLDGVDVTSASTYYGTTDIPQSTSAITYQPPSPLSKGKHEARVQGTSFLGRNIDYTWSFIIE